MAQETMFRGVARSPITALAAPGIDADDLAIAVVDAADLPTFPNYLVLAESEGDPDSETVLCASVAGSTVTLTSRGPNAKAWPAGTIVWRPLVVEDLDRIQGNVEDHEGRIVTLEGAGPYAPAGGWTAIAAFTATPASTSTITTTADLTATIAPGIPLRYAIGGTTYYGIVTAITSTLITLAGAPLSGTITTLAYGDASKVVTLPILLPGYYEAAASTAAIAAVIGRAVRWRLPPAYLVLTQVKTRVADSSSNGTVNPRIGGADVLASALTIGSTAWLSSVVGITVANYDIAFGDDIELNIGKGTGGNGQDLSADLTFVLR